MAHRQFMGLLRGAFTSGLLLIARAPQTLPHLAAALNVDEERAATLCLALEAYGVLIRDRDLYRLADQWAILTDPDAPIAFETLLDAAEAAAHALEHAALGGPPGGHGFWTLPSAARVALARVLTFDPASPYSPAMLRMMLQDYAPDIHAILAAGGRYLELGCGVGGTLLNLLRAYPAMTAVGIELAGDVLAEARQHAAALGVHQRVVFYQGDARDFGELAAFDVAFWSQSFFPPTSRALTLQVARYALKPGGFLVAPLLNGPLPEEDWRTEDGQQHALQRVLYSSWNIPVLSAQELQHEIEAAGFCAARLMAAPLLPAIIACLC